MADKNKSVLKPVRWPVKLHDAIVAAAEDEGRTFSNMVRRLCEIGIKSKND